MVLAVASALSYWFMFPACIAIAGLAISAGVSGATLLLPLFFLGFPLLGVPALNSAQAVGASLVLQIAAFGLAVYRYYRRGLVVWPAVRRICLLAIPAAVLGALLQPRVPVALFRLGFAAGLIVVSGLLVRVGRRPGATSGAAKLSIAELLIAGGAGGLITGIISAGAGEAAVPILARKGLALPAVAATATVLVAVTVGTATVVTATRLLATIGLHDMAWAVIAWGTPGAIIGEELAVRSQGRLPERAMRLSLSILFVLIALAFARLAFA